jgi:VWFA-related protein
MCCCLILAAQQQPPFRTEIRVVQVPVTVHDSKGANIDGLKARDFLVLDDGEPRGITLDTFGVGAAPISLVIAIQTASISKPALAKVRRIGGMIQPLVIGRRGEAAVVTFDDEIDWRLNFTSNTDAIQKTVKAIEAVPSQDKPQARMLDAVLDAADLMKDRKGRRVLLLISENKDRGSHAKLNQAVEAVEREGIEVFAANYSAQATTWIADPEDLPPPSGADYLAVFTEMFRLGRTNHALALTQATGGSDYTFLREQGIEKAIETLGVEVHSQYILGFPERRDVKGMHRIDVSLPNRNDARIRARRAYWQD